MQPVAAARTWDIPAIESVGAWRIGLQLDPDELRLVRRSQGTCATKHDHPRLRHYHYRVLTKRSGDIRLIEAPKPRLKEMQRQILVANSRQDSAASRRARIHQRPVDQDIRHAARGSARCLENGPAGFLPIHRARAEFRPFSARMGYPESVADLLGGICTNAAPRDLWKPARARCGRASMREARACTRGRILPQGAPTSPALANICAYRVDCRLAGLAQSAGAAYTRYADDLAFSGGEEFERARRAVLHARRGDPARRGFHRESPQDPDHAPRRAAAFGGIGRQPTHQRHASRFRPSKSHAHTTAFVWDPRVRTEPPIPTFERILTGESGGWNPSIRQKAGGSGPSSIRSPGRPIAFRPLVF